MELTRMTGVVPGSTTTIPTITSLPDWQVVGAADFTLDGRTDILWQKDDTGEIKLSAMDGTALIQEIPIYEPLTDTSWHVVGAADFTSDGKPDILWQNFNSGEAVLTEMDGTTIAQDNIPIYPAFSDPSWRMIEAIDFTEDGKADILWQNLDTGEAVLTEMDGTTIAQDNIPIYPAFSDPSWRIAGAADFTEDGKADLLWQNSDTGGVVVTEMDGTSIVLDDILIYASSDSNRRIAAPFIRVEEPKLLKHIFLNKEGSNPSNLVTVGSTLYFTAYDSTHGYELWKSDGTATGTELVKDINLGIANSDPANLVAVGNTLYFTAYTDATGYELWKSDGTTTGTVLVKDINPGVAESYPFNLVAAGNTLYFTAYDATNGYELWKSDGTTTGTVLVKDINPGTGDSEFSNPVVMGNTLYFSAFDPTNGYELWKSDGTTTGTVLVKDINAGTGSSEPQSLTVIGNTLYFTAFDATNGAELWKSDGTTAGTTLVKDINPGSVDSYPTKLTNVGGTLYFTAFDTTNGAELWKSDGAAAGTTLVKDINPGVEGSDLDDLDDSDNFVAIGNTLYFTAYDATNGVELWKSNGTTAGTTLVKDIVPGIDGSAPYSLTAVGSTLYFTAYDATNGYELWKSNGTAAGTVLVKDINAGVDDSGMIDLVALGNTLYFSALTAATGAELWKSNGTAAGTVLVKDINASANSSNPSNLAAIGNTLYFAASDAGHGEELWKSDGTVTGTVLIKDINPGEIASNPRNFTSVNNTVYFTATATNNGGDELWKTDGTAAGTVLVKDINPGFDSSGPDSLVAVQNTLYFIADDSTHGYELWKSDGTAAGTVLVKDINPGTQSSIANSLVVMGNTVYFSARDSVNGYELWKSDGTAAGTVLVKDINLGNTSSFPSLFTAAGSTVFFVANGGLWKTDGTTQGTVEVDNQQAGSIPYNLTAFNNRLYFTGVDERLWSSDGTTAGTGRVQRPNSLTEAFQPDSFKVVGNSLYFKASKSGQGVELWRTDGTDAGTFVVKDINPGAANSDPGELTAVGNTLYFSASNSSSGRELWSFTPLPESEGGLLSAQTINASVFNGSYPVADSDLSDPSGSTSQPEALQVPIGSTITVVSKKLSVQVLDNGNLVDGDTVLVTLNNKTVSVVPTRSTKPEIFSNLQPGLNTLDILPISQGSAPPNTTVTKLNGTQVYPHRDLDLSVGFYFLKFPQITILRSRHPESTQHILDAQLGVGNPPGFLPSNYRYPKLLTLDKFEPNAKARRTASLSNYRTSPFYDIYQLDAAEKRANGIKTERDEYPLATTVENFGAASVRPITDRDNSGSGGRFGRLTQRYSDKDVVEVVPVV